VIEETYVSHGPTKGIPSLSIRLIRCSQIAMLQSHYGVSSRRSRGLSKGREVRANIACPFATGHLHRISVSGRKRRNGARSMRDTYANPVEYFPLMLCHLMERVLGELPAANQGGLHTLHDYTHIVFKTMDHTECLCDCHPGFVLGQSIQLLQHSLNLAIAKKLLDEFL